MKPHKNLVVWNRSFQFVKALYEATGSYPSDEKFGLTSQIRRAGVSVPVNIAEGAARKSKREFIQFLHISWGSISELDTLLLLSKELDYLSINKYERLNNQLEEISKMLFGLIQKCKADLQ